jgi:hypothetical protein
MTTSGPRPTRPESRLTRDSQSLQHSRTPAEGALSRKGIPCGTMSIKEALDFKPSFDVPITVGPTGRGGAPDVV